jgi:hypothetical protein
MKTYRGVRTPEGCKVTVDGRSLPPRNDLFNHSPLGFEWGYEGSGPAQLALALLMDHLGDAEAAIAGHQRFKRKAVARFDRDEWSMTSDEIAQYGFRSRR